MSNLTDRIGTENVVMPGDAKGSPVTAESNFSIVRFPSVGSCLSDLPQQVTGGPTNQFQVKLRILTRGGLEYLPDLIVMGSLLPDC